MIRFSLMLCCCMIQLATSFATDHVCAQQVVQKVQAVQVYAVPSYAAQIQALNHQFIYTQVAPQIADYSAGVQQLKASPSYKEYLQDRANYLAWLENKYEEQKKEEQKALPTLLSQKCGNCHGQQVDDPKGGFRLLSSGNSADAIVSALKQIKDGKMPPKQSLTPEDKGKLMEELLSSQDQEE